MSQVAKKGDTVKVHYTGKFEDGKTFDSSEGKDPLQFTLGTGKVIVGFEQAIIGMTTGDSKTITVPATEAYGKYHSDRIFVVDKNKFPENITLKVGAVLQLQGKDDKEPPVVVTIINIEGEKVTLDANHPLAGKDLIFDLTLVEIVEK